MDDKARKILLETYWSPSGWKREPRASSEDFEYAKAQHVMFEPVKLSHDEAVARACAVVGRLTQRRVSDAFLASLSTRRLEWRSALGSYSVMHRMPVHELTSGERQCPICGLYAGQHEHDLSGYNFERLKWGGVRHADPVYAALDLELLLEDPAPAPTAEDLRIFSDLVAALSAVAPSVTSAALHKHFPPTLKANKAERDQVVAILGLCGVLETPSHPSFAEQFVPYRRRTLPDRHFVDMAYPACWWRGSDGLNSSRLQELFGHAL